MFDMLDDVDAMTDDMGTTIKDVDRLDVAERQAHRELAAAARPLAVGADHTAVLLDELARKG